MIKTLARHCEEAGIPLPSDLRVRFSAYADLLAEKNRVMNLTAITDPDGVAVKHFFDCMAVIHTLSISPGDRVIDVGTGAGFPGLVLAAMRPDVRVWLLDSVRKKLSFCEEAAGAMGLGNVVTLHLRAEDAGRDPALRAQFDLALARAVAPMEVLCELAVPLLRRGGLLAAMKGPGVHDELTEAAGMIGELGAEAAEAVPVFVPGQEGRWVARVRKTGETPARYPRRPGKRKG